MKHTLLSHKESIDILIRKLKNKEIFTFVRFGDGDYMIMYPKSIGRVVGKNNKFLITKEFRKELIDSYNIQDNNYLIATVINDLSTRSTFRNIDLNKLPTLVQRDKMLIFGCLMDTFIEDIKKFKEFTTEMCKTSTMLVGGYNHSNLDRAYGEIKHYVKVPQQNSCSEMETWFKEILKNLHKVDKIVLSAGFSSRVVAKRLWEIKKITVIDVGSVSDMLILNTPIINTIPQRSHLRIYQTEILRSLSELLGYKANPMLKISPRSEKRRRERRRNIQRIRERNRNLINERR